MSNIKIEMLSTGDEVLYGQIIDTNAAWLSDFLFEEGYLMTSRLTVGDNLNQLVATLIERSDKNNILVVNGGLGPTSDDMSAQAAALANNEKLVLHQAWLDEMTHYFSIRGRTMSDANRKQAMLPKSAVIINNPVGTACGFRMQIKSCTVFFTPGVPSELKQMIRHEILPYIKHHYPNENTPLCYRLTTLGRSESDLATEIEHKLSIDDGISIGYRSAMPIIELKITGSHQLKDKMDNLWHQLKILVQDNILYEGALGQQGEMGLATLVARLLNDKNLSVALFEQQTSGVIGYQLIEAGAPVVVAEVVPHAITDPLQYIADLRLLSNSDVAIGLVDFKENNSKFTLILITESQTHAMDLHYTSRKQNRLTEQQIYAAIALDALRRHLLDLPLIGPNVWLKVIKSTLPSNKCR